MARKNLLAGLMSPKLPAGNSGANALQENELEPVQPARLTLGGRGAIGAVTRSIENLKAAASEAGEMRARLEAGQTVIDLDPDLVDPSPVLDRMPAPDGELTEFIEAIRLSGQQVPILVRPHPTTPGRYQTAYGHRRTRAARVLARPIRAVVRAMTDAELVVAQGQENSARRDLSFIERALYAAKLEDAGFDRETLTAALNVDKTGLSQLISVAVRVPREVVNAIGPAPKIGRDRWTELAARFEVQPALEAVSDLLATDAFRDAGSDQRFELVLRAAKAPRAKPRRAMQAHALVDQEGRVIGRLERAGKGARLILTQPSFADFLAAELSRLHAAWRSAGSSTSEPGGAPKRKR